MKKIFAFAIAMVTMFSAFNANAQENYNNNDEAQAVTIKDDGSHWSDKKNQVSVSYGVCSFTSFLDAFGSGMFHDHEDYTCYGDFNVAYNYNINKRFSLGMDASFEQGKITNEYRGYKKSMQYACLMPSARVYWFHASNVSMYSKLALGACIYTQKMTEKSTEYEYYNDPDKTEVWGAVQATPVGVEFGGQSFRGFAEVGIGFEGGMQAGIRYAF